jgi:hypothetical protein
MVNISVGKVAGTIVVLVGIGALLALGWSDSDLVHPIRSIADYQRSQMEIGRDALKREIDVRQYAILQAARTQAEVQKILEENRHTRALHAQQMRQEQERMALVLDLRRLIAQAAIVVGGLSALALSVGVSVYIGRQRPAPVRVTADAWTPDRKQRAVAAARRREREQRQAMLGYPAAKSPRSEPNLRERWVEEGVFSVPACSGRREGGNGATIRSLYFTRSQFAFFRRSESSG